MSYRTPVVASHLRRPLPRFLFLSEKEAVQKDVDIARDAGGILRLYDRVIVHPVVEFLRTTFNTFQVTDG